MLTSPLAPYLLWAKSRQPAPLDLAGSNLVHCSMDELPGARQALELWVPNDNGYPPLLEAIARHYGVTPDRVTTSIGCSGANFIAVAALAGAGDEVLVERPAYDPLVGACRLMGATVRRFDRRFEDGFRVDLDALRGAITPRTRLIILTSPHNPSGVALDAATLAAIGRLADPVGAHVLVDEVYLDGANALLGPTEPLLVPAARLDGPFLSTSSLTKSYGLAGLRAGWIVAPPRVTERLRRTRDVIDNAGTAPADALAALAWSHHDYLIDRARSILRANVDRARRFFTAHPRLEVAAPPGSSVTFPRIANTADAGPFVAKMLSEHGVALAPGAFFEAPAHFRISLAGRAESLDRGLARLSRALGGPGAG